MNILAFALIIAIVLSAIAAPVVFALRRRARLAALLAGTIGFGTQALYVTYLQSGAVGPEQGALAMLIGIPGVALITCALAMFFIARYTRSATS
jgi:hypothetical protein